MPCSATAPSIKPTTHSPLDKNIGPPVSAQLTVVGGNARSSRQCVVRRPLTRVSAPRGEGRCGLDPEWWTTPTRNLSRLWPRVRAACLPSLIPGYSITKAITARARPKKSGTRLDEACFLVPSGATVPHREGGSNNQLPCLGMSTDGRRPRRWWALWQRHQGRRMVAITS